MDTWHYATTHWHAYLELISPHTRLQPHTLVICKIVIHQVTQIFRMLTHLTKHCIFKDWKAVKLMMMDMSFLKFRAWLESLSFITGNKHAQFISLKWQVHFAYFGDNVCNTQIRVRIVGSIVLSNEKVSISTWAIECSNDTRTSGPQVLLPVRLQPSLNNEKEVDYENSLNLTNPLKAAQSLGTTL